MHRFVRGALFQLFDRRVVCCCFAKEKERESASRANVALVGVVVTCGALSFSLSIAELYVVVLRKKKHRESASRTNGALVGVVVTCSVTGRVLGTCECGRGTRECVGQGENAEGRKKGEEKSGRAPAQGIRPFLEPLHTGVVRSPLLEDRRPAVRVVEHEKESTPRP